MAAAPRWLFCSMLTCQRAQAPPFAINPTTADANVSIGDVADMGTWRQIADCDRFIHSGSRAATRKVEAQLDVPGLGCGLWTTGS